MKLRTCGTCMWGAKMPPNPGVPIGQAANLRICMKGPPVPMLVGNTMQMVNPMVGVDEQRGCHEIKFLEVSE